MKRCNEIFNHPLYRERLNKTAEYERDRIYCLHDLAHAMDVARVAYIISLERGLNINKEIIYAAALLHDIGRCEQYHSGTPHDIASVRAAEEILPDCGFCAEEIKRITTAISEHRTNKPRSSLGEILCIADNKSRMCLSCNAISTCKWTAGELNMEISV